MDQNEVSGLNLLLVKKNIKLLTLGLQVKIFAEKIYGDKSFYEDGANLVYTMPVIKTVKSRYFSISQNEFFADLMLDIDTRHLYQPIIAESLIFY